MDRPLTSWNWNSRGRPERSPREEALAEAELQALHLEAQTPEDRKLALRLKQLAVQLDHAQTGAVAALSLVLDLKSLKTGQYARQLSGWAMRVGEQMGLAGADLADLEIASLLYDVGKIGVPDEILLKPGKLTDEEYALVRKHPEYGWGILRAIPGFERAALLILHHHERWDGTGYPAGLAREEIPPAARIIAVVDALEAMLSDRPYRPGFSPTEVISRLRPEAGSQFDPSVVEKFVWIAGWSLPDLDSINGSRGPSPANLAVRALGRSGLALAGI